MTAGSEAESARPGVSPVTSEGLRATLLTADGVPIDAAYSPAEDPSGGLAVVLAHGFSGALDRPSVRRAAAVMNRSAAVVTFSFRGHGRSGGHSTVGDREVLDLAAAVSWARALGHRRVATVGFSMGGSVVLRHAALFGSTVEIQPAGPQPAGPGLPQRSPGAQQHATSAPKHEPSAPKRAAGRSEHMNRRTDIACAPGTTSGAAAPGPGLPAAAAGASAAADAVISVSAPARWYYRGTAPMRRLHWAVTRPTGRLVSRYALRTRISSAEWDPVPLPPVAAVPLIAPRPLLLVHGDRDPYFPLDHPRTLAAAGDPSSTDLWIEPGFGHAENAASTDLLTRITTWATTHT
ncbi:alpha/beta hydrolase [Streptomyces palmae]|uniref:Alpha/beta fold hydrolase n=1 Tax=Streptomyces palmae TaxID=1701085 RepID=A0A4Z0H8G1_9ACTN|nr:alpha/beta fold hydrolase [Streptomyces palmae]TGB12586.1 alpha/beta fold hydrolase [Streptomyces palmae]